MIGQNKIKNLIETSSLDNFPNSLILLGEKGSGKHTICDLISDKLNLQIIDISEKLTQEMIDEIYTRVEPYIYIISDEKLTIKNQNSILKFLEEPLKNSYIILLVENRNKLLPTILNRCQIWELEKYSTNELSQFIITKVDSRILDIAKTPGDVILMQDENNKFADLYELIDKLIEKIPIASFSNILLITNRINFDGKESDKFDLTVFLRTLVWLSGTKVLNSDNIYYQEVYKLVNELSNNMSILNINKKTCFENFLVKMKVLRC